MSRDLINLFNVNPPPDELLEKLFCNRANELALALDGLSSRSTANEILAVHGESRTGKSHFVRVLLKKLPARDASWRAFTIMANHRGAVRPVLEDIFVALWKALPEVSPKVPDGERANFDDFVRDQDRRRPLLLGEHAEETHEVNAGRTDVLEAGAGLRVGILEGRATDRREERSGESEKVTARPPTDAQLVEWIRDVLDALRTFEPARPVLLFVDDLDLLERQKTAAGDVCADLIQRLLNLAAHPHALVMVTVRTAWFNQRHKELNNFVQLPFFEVDTLREIYAVHVRELFDGREVLRPDALELVLRESNGQVGMFLKTCRDLLQWGYSQLPLDVAKVGAFVDHKLREFRRMPECVLFLPLIEEALRTKQRSLKIDEDLRDTPLLYTVLTPVPGQSKQYLINTLWSSALIRASTVAP